MLHNCQPRGGFVLRLFFFPAVLFSLCIPGLLSLSAHGQQVTAEEGGRKCTASVLSLNLQGTRDSQAILAALRKAGLEGAGVMLFQEVIRPRDGALGAVDEVAQSLGMQVAFAPGFALRNGDQEGLAVLSRYPMVEDRIIPLPRYNLLWKSRQRVALAVLIETPAGPLQVYDVHLDTRINLKARLAQLRPIAEEAGRHSGLVLLGGDFNTNPFRWGAHTLPLVVAPDQGVGVLKFMEGLGFSSAFARGKATSDFLRMQLDWFFLRNLRVGPAAIEPIPFSDHHALYACLQSVPAPEGTQPRRSLP
jgi:endonuclease/exonuclease/phosphatase family metal-dependent hydrolase